MMPKFDSIEEAQKYIRAAVEQAMQTTVKDVVEKEMASTTKSVVYGSYNPTYYHRRNDMDSVQNIQTTVEGLHLTARNVTPPNDQGFDFHPPHTPATTGKDLAEVVQTGAGYDFWEEAFARPFNEKTESNLSGSNQLQKAIAKVLRAKGIKISK